MPQYDELLEDAETSGAFDAELEPLGFEPPPDANQSGVVIVEPPIIHIGRARRKDEIKEVPEVPDESGDDSGGD